jgi:hypothetical protein
MRRYVGVIVGALALLALAASALHNFPYCC